MNIGINKKRLRVSLPIVLGVRSYPVSEAFETQVGVVVEVLNDVAIQPTSAVVLQLLRQIPVINSDHCFDAGRQQGVDQIVVVSDAGLVDAIRQLSGWNDTRPRQGKPIEVHLQPFE